MKLFLALAILAFIMGVKSESVSSQSYLKCVTKCTQQMDSFTIEDTTDFSKFQICLAGKIGQDATNSQYFSAQKACKNTVTRDKPKAYVNCVVACFGFINKISILFFIIIFSYLY
eukprot:TRINITY_DN379_c0_g1_i2.p1 TRINITY_DN379_c0_g1~~TRINITY_DN379_c0_g1_i2.p1  ORF type:complete len:115 (-),score=18.61 TRINITY_DN379_c0_g1_i2:22-366(-)